MGVPRLFYYLYDKYKQVTFVKTNTRCDNLYLDFNSIIHTVSRKIVDARISEKKEIIQEELWAEIFQNISKYTDRIISLCNPNFVFIAIDGGAPRSKMNQQRGRRFVSSKDNKNINVWDSNAITPGTIFMDELHKYLTEHFNSSSNVRISSCAEPGEGEQKIIRYIKALQDKGLSHIIYALDADVILQSLICTSTKIKLLRENMFRYNTQYDFILYHIPGVREAIYQDIKDKIDAQLNKARILNDYVYMSFFVGNDFMPNLRNLEISKNGLDYLIDIYCEQFNDSGTYLLNKDLKPNYITLKRMLESLNEVITYDFPNENTAEFVNNYYNNKNIDRPNQEVCEEYLKITQWTLSYYFEDCPSYSYYYPFLYAPLLQDLINYLNNVSHPNFTFTRDYPVSSIVQLLCVLPPRSKYLLPDKYRQIFDEYKEYYPDTFHIDMNGKTHEWMAVVVLPFIDLHVIEDAVNKIV